MRRIIKKQKQQPIAMIQPPPTCNEPAEKTCNRIDQGRNIINELDQIKARVDQIIQKYEAGDQADAYSSESMPIRLEAMENLLRHHESFRASKEKELSSARDFFRKCTYLAKSLEEVVLSTAEERMKDKSTTKAEEFESALHNTTEMLHQIKTLNAQMIMNLSSNIESQKLKLQVERAKLLESQNGYRDEIINKYTSEAIKREKLERTKTTISDELDMVKSHNQYLMKQTEAEKLKLKEAEGSRKELEEIAKKLRIEVNVLKHQMSLIKKAKSAHMDNYQTKITNYNVNTDQEKPGNKSAKNLKMPSPLIEASLSNPANQQKITMSPKTNLQTKRQAATKYTSKVIDQKLDYMEELMIRGQQNIGISEKQLSNLDQMTADALKQKYKEEYACLSDSVEVITFLLGSEGSEKLTAVLEVAAPEKLFVEQTDKSFGVYEKISSMKEAVSQVLVGLKLFIKLKRQLTETSNLDRNVLKKVIEVQNWLDHELSKINMEITELVELYEFDKQKIEKSQVIYLDQLSRKLDINTQKLVKSLEKLKLPEHTRVQTILENISRTIAELKDKPTAALHKFPTAVRDGKKSVHDMITNDIQKINSLSMPAIDEIRMNVANHLKAKHNVTISTKSWRARMCNKPIPSPTVVKQRKPSIREQFLPTLATFVECGRDETVMKTPSKAVSKTNDLPSVQSRTNTSKVSAHHTNFQNKKSTHAQVLQTHRREPELTITGRKSH